MVYTLNIIFDHANQHYRVETQISRFYPQELYDVMDSNQANGSPRAPKILINFKNLYIDNNTISRSMFADFDHYSKVEILQIILKNFYYQRFQSLITNDERLPRNFAERWMEAYRDGLHVDIIWRICYNKVPFGIIQSSNTIASGISVSKYRLEAEAGDSIENLWEEIIKLTLRVIELFLRTKDMHLETDMKKVDAIHNIQRELPIEEQQYVG